MPPNINLEESGFTIGIEVEYPVAQSWESKLYGAGGRSDGLRREVENEPWPLPGRPVGDASVGLEVVSPELHLSDAPKWYRDVIDHIEDNYNAPYAPTGLIKHGDNNTAGMHIHLSPLSREQAKLLFDISQTEWAKAMFCSSIVSDDAATDWRVFRGGRFCRMNFDGGNRYDCLNDRGGGHWEWRLPEPSTVGHFDEIIKFLRLFEQNADDAIQFAQEVLDEHNSPITSLSRAEAVGMDIEEPPDVVRTPFEETAEFFEHVRNRWDAPEIYRVNHDEGMFYTFDSRITDTVEVYDGIEVQHGQVLWADTLETVQDDDLQSEVFSAYRHRNDDEPPQTEATEYVKEIVKKKKA